MALRKRGFSLLFDDSKGQHRNDTITLDWNFSPYGRTFHRAASSLAKPFLEERGNFLNFDGLPVVYLYRHTLELYLYPLAEMAEAHRYVETQRKRGNVVIDVPLMSRPGC